MGGVGGRKHTPYYTVSQKLAVKVATVVPNHSTDIWQWLGLISTLNCSLVTLQACKRAIRKSKLGQQ